MRWFAWLWMAIFALFSLPAHGEVAVIVNTRLFHYEVVVYFTYHLQRLGYEVQILLGADGSRNPIMAKTGPELINEYTSAIHHLPTIFSNGSQLPVPMAFKLLVLINADENSDHLPLCKLNAYDTLLTRAEKVIMMVHLAGNVAHLQHYCMPPRCTAWVLGKHLMYTALNYLTPTTNPSVRVLGGYGVFGFSERYRHLIADYKAAHRDDIRHFVIQGSLRHNRRNYRDLFSCVRNLMLANIPIALTLVGNKAPNSVVLPHPIATVATKHLDKPFEEFFSIVCSQDALVTFANESFQYFTNRSTSSITIGVTCELPLVLPKALLEKHYCLRDKPIHRRVTKATDCETLEEVMALSNDELKEMKKEVAACKNVWLKDSTMMLRGFLQEAVNRSDPIYDVDRCKAETTVKFQK